MDVNNENKALHLLSELLVQIRGIAGDAANLGHVSCLGRGRFTPEEACRAIYALADAAHNLPDGVTMPRAKGFLLTTTMEQSVEAGIKVLGEDSPLAAFLPRQQA